MLKASLDTTRHEADSLAQQLSEALHNNNALQATIDASKATKVAREAELLEAEASAAASAAALAAKLRQEDRKSTRLNSSHLDLSRMPSSA